MTTKADPRPKPPKTDPRCKPTKAEMEEDVSIPDATPDELAFALYGYSSY